MPAVTHEPTGDYPHPAPFHRLDLIEAADELAALLPGTRRQSRTLAREAGVSLVLMVLEAGDAVQEHAAKGVVTIQALRGHVSLTVAGETRDLRPGQLAMLQPGVRHDIRAEEQSAVLLTVTGGDDHG